MLAQAMIRKTTTGLVGLEINSKARMDLIQLYNQTLKEIQVIPKDAHYRLSVEQITNYRLKVVESTEDEAVIEKDIGGGQLEELIEQAKDELHLIPIYFEDKLWEAPVLQEDDAHESVPWEESTPSTTTTSTH